MSFTKNNGEVWREKLTPVFAYQHQIGAALPDWITDSGHVVRTVFSADWKSKPAKVGEIWRSEDVPDSIYVRTSIGWTRCRAGEWIVFVGEDGVFWYDDERFRDVYEPHAAETVGVI